MDTVAAVAGPRTGYLQLSAPRLAARLSNDVLASTLARLLASGAAQSKADLTRVTCLARSTVDSGLRYLFQRGVIRRGGLQRSTGRGRAAEILELSPEFGYVLVADCGIHRTRLEVFDMRQVRVGAATLSRNIREGPEVVVSGIIREFKRILGGLPHRPLIAVVGTPGPVDYQNGYLLRPPYMPGWDGYPIVRKIADALNCDVILENDVNLRALNEARAREKFAGPLLYIHIGFGIGAGVVSSDGQLLRGADGAAGEIGHMPIAGNDTPCGCGSSGCLESIASGAALVRRMLGSGPTAPVSLSEFQYFRDRLKFQSPDAVKRYRWASRQIADVIAGLVLLLNPRQVVVGGELAVDDDGMLAIARATVYRRASPLATRDVSLRLPTRGESAAISGGLAAGIERALTPDLLSRAPVVAP